MVHERTSSSPSPPWQSAETEAQTSAPIDNDAAVLEVPQELLEAAVVCALRGGVHGHAAGQCAEHLPVAKVRGSIEKLWYVHRAICMHQLSHSLLLMLNVERYETKAAALCRLFFSALSGL